jgi:hypothetical protein
LGVGGRDAEDPHQLAKANFGGGNGNFEVVILERNVVVHWWRDNADPTFP